MKEKRTELRIFTIAEWEKKNSIFGSGIRKDGNLLK